MGFPKFSFSSAGARRGPCRRRDRLLITGGILVAGGVWMLLGPGPRSTSAEAAPPAAVEPTPDGASLYTTHCASCHGLSLEGESGRGPSLIGVGQAATFFQLATGRMPEARLQLQPPRTDPAPEFDPKTEQGRQGIAALSAFVAAHGGGPALPAERGQALVGPDPVRGGELFRANCASCHNFTGRGGALTDRKFAPPLDSATPDQIYAAMLSGPAAMPTFSDRQLTPADKKNVIAYVLSVRGQRNAPGGFDLGEWGPVPEGLVALGVGLVVLVVISGWIGERA